MNFARYFNYLLLFPAVLILSCNTEIKDAPVEEHREEEEETIVALTAAQVRTAGIRLGKIEDKQISGTIRVNGLLDVPPQQLVSISAPLGGFLKSTSLLQGSRVRKGQRIATVENLEFIQIQQDYLEAKGNFEFAKADYERQQELAKQNVNSEKTLQQAKSNFTSWQVRYAGLREKLKVLNLNAASVEAGDVRSTINLYSPIDGFVTEVNVNIGKFVNPADILFEIVDTEHLHAELIVFEKDVPKLKIGQRVRFTLANESTERLATVYLIGREISEDRTIRIHCHIDEKDEDLLPGMYLNGVVEAGGALVPALPAEAIVEYQGKKYVFIATEGAPAEKGKEAEESASAADEQRFKIVEVETGNSEFGFIEVTLAGRLEKNSKIVLKGAYALLSAMKNSEEGGHGH